MRIRHSDIFESYIKLSEEKDTLVKTAKEERKESKELKKYKNDLNARHSSDSIETIEALYGVKPETIKGMEYDYNIVEIAHKSPVVIAPSYDKINALVENINERANIIHNKVMAPAPSGSLFLLKDAEKELMMELVKIGNDMDNADEEELRCLADNCLESLKKKADWMDSLSDFGHKAVDFIGGNKGDRFVSDVGGVGEGAVPGIAAGALAGALLTSWSGPGALVGAGIGGVLGGLAGYIFNTSPKLKNIRENAKDLEDQLGDLKRAVPEESVFFSQVEDIMTKLVKSSDDYLTAINAVHLKEMKGETVNQSEIDEVKKDTTAFINMIGSFSKARELFNTKAKEGAFAKALGSIPHPGIANDIEDVTDAFNTLSVAIDNLKATMSGVVEKAKEEVKKAPPEMPAKDESKPSGGLGQQFFDMVGHKPTDEELSFFNMLEKKK